MLKKDNNFQRGSRLEDEGHTIYELFNQLMQRAQKKYEAIVVYQSVEARKNMNYDQIIRELTPYKEELNSEIFSRLQQEREEIYNRSVKMQEEETPSIEYFTTLHSQYAWCGEYKDAPQRMKELTEQRMVFEAQQKKKNQRLWITIASSIAVLVVVSVSGYFMYRNYEGSTSLNHLSVKERMAIEEFCKKNELNSKEFIWKKEKDSSKEFIYITYEPIQLFKDSPQEEGSSEIGRDQTIYINPKDKKE